MSTLDDLGIAPEVLREAALLTHVRKIAAGLDLTLRHVPVAMVRRGKRMTRVTCEVVWRGEVVGYYGIGHEFLFWRRADEGDDERA